jgi:hypothetical protein
VATKYTEIFSRLPKCCNVLQIYRQSKHSERQDKGKEGKCTGVTQIIFTFLFLFFSWSHENRHHNVRPFSPYSWLVRGKEVSQDVISSLRGRIAGLDICSVMRIL